MKSEKKLCRYMYTINIWDNVSICAPTPPLDSVFFGLGFESLTGVSGTVAALVASLLAGVVFGTS